LASISISHYIRIVNWDQHLVLVVLNQQRPKKNLFRLLFSFLPSVSLGPPQ